MRCYVWREAEGGSTERSAKFPSVQHVRFFTCEQSLSWGASDKQCQREPVAKQGCTLRIGQDCLSRYKLNQVGKAPSDTSGWVVVFELTLEHLPIPLNVFRKATLWHAPKTKRYCVDRRLPFPWLSCTMKISHKRRIFWTDHNVFKVRTGWWAWPMHCNCSLSSVPADSPAQLFNLRRYIIQCGERQIRTQPQRKSGTR